MVALLTPDKITSLGSKSRNLRISLLLTQQKLASIAGVATEEVALFEKNLPVRLDVKRRLLRHLWARKGLKTGVSDRAEYANAPTMIEAL